MTLPPTKPVVHLELHTGDLPQARAAQDEANRAGLDIIFTTVLPKFAPMAGVGGPAVQAYAARDGQPVDEYLEQLGPLVTPQIAGTALVELLRGDAADVAPSYLLTGDGLQKLP